MNLPNSVKPRLVFWLLVLGLWGLLVLAFTGQLVFSRDVPWAQALRISLRDWFAWLFLAPAAAWLAFQFPLERGKFRISVPMHIAGCALAVLCYEVLVPFRPVQEGAPGLGPRLRYRGGQLPPEGPPGAAPPIERAPPGPGNPAVDRPPAPGRPLGITHIGSPTSRFLDQAIVHARFNIPIYWVIVSIAHALTYYRRSEERERKALELEARLSDAKLQALRMQLHPHFLFNTLNAISTLVHKNPQAADEMIGNLSELLRATLDTAQQEIPLRQELEFLERYLEIQQARFGEHLRVEKHIDAAALDAAVPTLILQPLVENAIRHGIEPQLRPGVIQVEAKVDNGALKLAVRDNGAGMKQPGGNEGVGLANTRSRLQQLYGSEARLTFKSGGESGCAVELTIPLREQNPRVDR